MGNKNLPPNPQEEPEKAYQEAYAERYGLEPLTPTEGEAVPEDVAPDQFIDSNERIEGYENRERAVEGARKALELAAPGEEKQRATLRLENAERNLQSFISLRGTPDKPSTFGAEEQQTTTVIDKPNGWAEIMSLPVDDTDIHALLVFQADLFKEPASKERDALLKRVNKHISELSSKLQEP